jgi:hypothetical protein
VEARPPEIFNNLLGGSTFARVRFGSDRIDRVVKEALYDIPADEMVLHDFGRPLFIDVRVPRSFGIDDHVGPVAALPQTPAEGDLDPSLEGVFHQVVL